MDNNYGGQLDVIKSNALFFLLQGCFSILLGVGVWYVVLKQQMISAGNTSLDPSVIRTAAWLLIFFFALFALASFIKMTRSRVTIYEHGLTVRNGFTERYIAGEKIKGLEWEEGRRKLLFIPFGKSHICHIIGENNATLATLSSETFSRLRKKMAAVQTRIAATEHVVE